MTATISLIEAAQILGIGRSTAYKVARNGEFPTPVIKIGGSMRVPVKPLLDLLGLDELPELAIA